ncbi:MAG: hypothetical protein OEY59_08475 [Deltaproteobacteria bacterium]|nr:hypothetical protein [Deltaproteobacteria bacterium]
MVRFMRELLPEERKWLARAVVGIILADGVVEKDQVVFMKKLFKVFDSQESRETLEEVVGLLKEKKIPKIGELKVSGVEHQIYILDILSAAVFANGKKLRQETDVYFEAGKKLGIGPGTLSYRISLEAEKFRVERKLRLIEEDIREKFGFLDLKS